MNQEQKLFFPSQYIQGYSLIERLPEIMGKYGTNMMVIVAEVFEERIKEIMKAENSCVVEVFGGECTFKEVDRLYGIAETKKVTVIAGMGGGKTLDSAKLVADKLGVPVIIIPTIASTDAPCTGNAVVYDENGVVVDFIKQKEHPKAVIVDTEIIVKAPVRFLVAGMGDALSTGYEADSVALSGAKTYNGGKLTETGLALARLATQIVLKYGRQAMVDCSRGEVTCDLEKVIEANILLSGIGFESTNIATAHTIHNALTQIPRTKKYQHGEKVAFGVLVGLHLNDASEEELYKVYSFCKDVGLPTTLDEVGLDNPTLEELKIISEDACGEYSFIFNEPVEISVKKVLKAILAADNMGRNFKI
ncbi:MAG: glycerol dehydrogenase [Firmicutes bacterium]|nr:glycerol dehydrogenase [Bacillota bacterium]